MKDREYNHSLKALIINPFSIPFEDSINAQALQYESAMVDVYTKVKPDSFKSQLQAVLTALNEDIKGVQGASGCPKTKIFKRRLEDQEDAPTTPKDETSIEYAGGTVAAPVAAVAAAAPAPVGRSLQLLLHMFIPENV
jgi:hypothetical protein